MVDAHDTKSTVTPTDAPHRALRIAVYHNLPSGGALRVVEKCLEHLSGGHTIELFLPTTANTTFARLDRFAQRVHIFPMRAHSTPMDHYVQILRAPSFGRRVARAIDGGGFDVAFLSASQITTAPEILPYLRTPSLYFCPEHYRYAYDGRGGGSRSVDALLRTIAAEPHVRLRKRFDRRATLKATRIVTHSSFAATNLRRIYGVDPELVHNGVDVQLFRPLGVRRRNIVLCVGAFDPLKGHDHVIDAVARIDATRRPKVVIVGDRGDPAYARSLADSAVELGVELEIEREISTAELVGLYNESALHCAAQHDEPFGLTTLEAMACCTPVVAVEEGGFKETVTDGVTGLLCGRDPASLAPAIETVLGDPELAAALGQRGRADAVERWQWSRTGQRMEEVLLDIAGNAPHGPDRSPAAHAPARA